MKSNIKKSPVTTGNIKGDQDNCNKLDHEDEVVELFVHTSFMNKSNLKLPKKLYANSMEELISDAYISKISKFFGLSQRSRKLDINSVIKAWILSKVANTSSGSEFKIAQAFDRCMFDANIKLQSLHYHLNKESFIKVLNAIATQQMWFHYDLIKKQLTTEKVLLQDILKCIEVSNLVAIDGTCIPANPQVDKQLQKTSVGRKRNKHSQRAGHQRSSSSNKQSNLKAHVLFDCSSSAAIGSIITHSTFSERKAFKYFLNHFKNHSTRILFEGDRGFYSQDIVKHVTECGHDFLLRLKTNSTLIIIKAQDINGNEYTELAGEEISSDKCTELVNKLGYLDCQVEHPTIETSRVIIKRNDGSDEESKDKIMYLITSVSSEKASAQRIALLYKLRWQIENEGMKMLKSNCGLGKINSGKVNLNVCNILASLCAYNLQINYYLHASNKLYELNKEQVDVSHQKDIKNQIDKVLKSTKIKENVHLPKDVSIAKNMSNTIIKNKITTTLNNKISISKLRKLKQEIIEIILTRCLKDKTVSGRKVKLLKDIRLTLITMIFS